MSHPSGCRCDGNPERARRMGTCLRKDCPGVECPFPELLDDDEQRELLKRAEDLWADLQKNNLGGFSGINRPFYILHEFKKVIEEFGHRDVGLTWSKDQLDARRERMTPSIWNVAKIDADTDAAIADHAREPHELPRVGTMVMVPTLDEPISCIVSHTSHSRSAAAYDMRAGHGGTLVLAQEDWHYATPEQRRVAWGGEG